MALVISTRPNLDIINLDELKSHLKISATDEDELLYTYMKAAISWAEDYTGYRFPQQTWIHYLDKWPSDIYTVPYPPLQSVTSVKYYDGSNVQQTLVADTDYRVDIRTKPARIEPINSWPGIYDKVNPIEITFVCGYQYADQVDPIVKQALFLLVSDMYENRQQTVITQGTIGMVKNTITAQLLLNQIKIFNKWW